MCSFRDQPETVLTAVQFLGFLREERRHRHRAHLVRARHEPLLPAPARAAFLFIKDELGVSYAALGFLVALFYTLSGLLQPLAGFVVDRYGARSVLLGGRFVLRRIDASDGFSTSYAMLALGAALGGIGNSVFHPRTSRSSTRASAARLGYAFSAHGVVGYVGYAVAPVFGVAIGAAFGWQAALLAGAALGVGVARAAAFSIPSTSRSKRSRRKRRSRPRQACCFAAPVVLCFVYFTVFAAGLAGLQSFGVSAMVSSTASPRPRPRARLPRTW